MKRYLLRSPPLRSQSQRIRSLIVRWAHELHCHCAVIVIPTEWPPRIVAEGWENWHILYLPRCIQPRWLAGSVITGRTPWWHLPWHLMMCRQVCPGVSAAVVTDRGGMTRPGGHCLGVNPRLATPDVLCVRSNTATCDGKCSQRGKLDKILLIVLKSRSYS